MKHLKLWPIVAASLFLALFISSCSKNKNEPLPEVSGLSFFNAAPGAPGVKFYLGTTWVANEQLLFGEHLAYQNAYSGKRDIYAYEGSTKKVSGEITLEKGKMYSVFLAGAWNDANFVLLEDSLTKPKPGKAHLRFLNMSPDTGAVDLGLTNGSTLIKKKLFKKNSGFVELAGDTKYKFVIRNNVNKQDTIGLAEVTLKAGKSYTVWTKGLKEGTGQSALQGSIVENY